MPSFRSLFQTACVLGVGLIIPASGFAQDHDPFEDPPINYSKAVPVDAATKLNEAFRLKADEIRSWPARKRLRWLLEQLDIPVESQLLVFSKTSIQRKIISPENPRVLFFSDEAYVGWVPGGIMELAVFDPTIGPTFYILDAQESGPHRSLPAAGSACSATSVTNIRPDCGPAPFFPTRTANRSVARVAPTSNRPPP